MLKQSGKPERAPANVEHKTDQAAADGKQTATTAATDPAQAGDALKQWFERVKASA